MKSERLKNSSLNISSNVVVYLVQTVLSFVVRTFFIKVFGENLLGLDSLLVNLLAMLSIAELGISTAISYGLYKPLAKKDTKKINAYMSFYKKVYFVIGIVVILLGFLILFFLKWIVKDYSYEHLYLVYFIYLFDTASMYFVSYKEVLLMADQKNYKVFKYNFSYKLIYYLSQLFVLFVIPNYIIYLMMMLVSKFGNRILINRYISKNYSYVDFSSKEKLTNNDISTIKKNVYGLFCFKIGDYVINSTDNIIISRMINLVVVGIYTNYLSITMILRTIIKNVFNGITASLGNLTTEGNKDSEKEVFDIMVFMGLFISGYVTICFMHLINPFIQIWLGKKYVLPYLSMIIICINFYLMCNQLPLDSVKEANGFYTKDRYVPIIQSIINIILSIILTYFIGFNGVLLGTTISYLLTVFWIKPWMLHKYIYKESVFKYYVNFLKFSVLLLLIYLINNKLIDIMNLSVNFIGLIISGIIISIIYVFVVSLVYFNKKEYRYLYNNVKSILNGYMKKGRR